jgi:hypothetical protein
MAWLNQLKVSGSNIRTSKGKNFLLDDQVKNTSQYTDNQ